MKLNSYLKHISLLLTTLIIVGCNEPVYTMNNDSYACESKTQSCNIQPDYIVTNSTPFFLD